MYQLLGVLGPLGPTLYWGLYVSWCLYWYFIYRANNWGVVCKLFFTNIVCNVPTIWGISKSCWVSFVPLGPEQGGCMSVGLYWGLYVSCSLHQYCMYRANNWGVVCKLFFTSTIFIMPTIGGMNISCWVSYGPSGQEQGVVCQLLFKLVLFVSCQLLGGCM